MRDKGDKTGYGNVVVTLCQRSVHVAIRGGAAKSAVRVVCSKLSVPTSVGVRITLELRSECGWYGGADLAAEWFKDEHSKGRAGPKLQPAMPPCVTDTTHHFSLCSCGPAESSARLVLLTALLLGLLGTTSTLFTSWSTSQLCPPLGGGGMCGPGWHHN